MANAPHPYRHRRALPRLLDRYRRILATLLAATALVSAVLVVRPPPEPGTDVLVAARDLTATDPLSAQDLTTRQLPDTALPEGALDADAETAGHTLTGPVRRGEVITDARLSDPPARAYGPGLIAVPVRVADPGAVELLAPGNRVDILAASGHDDLQQQPARTGSAVEVVRDRPVLALPAESGQGGEGGALILIAAEPAEARELAGHSAAARLSITIRG